MALFYPEAPEKCENCRTNPVWHYNETVRSRGTENVKIMNICLPCFTKITGAK